MKKLFFLFLIFINCDNSPKQNKFVSSHNYILLLPENWSKYEDEKNTDAFFNAKKWTGNLRITPIVTDKASDIVFEETKTNKAIKKIKTKNGFTGISFEETTEENCIYYWYIYNRNNLFVCSFTIDLDDKDSLENKKEIQEVYAIISSIAVK